MADTSRTSASAPATGGKAADHAGNIAAVVRLTEAQRRYLERGLTEAGGKLPLFDRDGREVAHKTIEACIAHGWAERWVSNPIRPDWPVCRLTAEGYRVLGHSAPGGSAKPAEGSDGGSGRVSAL